VSWQDFYLVCFVVGFALSLVAFLSGALEWHLPHGLHLPHGISHAGPAAHAAGGPGPGAHGPGSGGASPFNFASVMAFLAWFGGAGYLLTGRGSLSRLAVLVAAAAVGAVGALLVFGFLTKVLLRHERELDAADFRMEGVLGRVTVPIREAGTGEVVYSQGGTRRSVGARSERGAAIGRGAEVVVTRYESGIAYVRPWDEFEREEIGQRESEKGSAR
jgi:hypothetical protein